MVAARRARAPVCPSRCSSRGVPSWLGGPLSSTARQQRPQTRRPSGHVVAAPASVSQLSLHVACAPQVTAQSPRHFTSQFEESLHETALPAPRLNLQSAMLEHVADDRAPAFSSHFELATHVIMLASPPLPLHSELSLHVRIVAPSEAALHFAPVSHRRVQPAALQVVLQSVPAVQVHLFSWAHMQPAPKQVAGGRPEPSLEHARPISGAAATMTRRRAFTLSMVHLRGDCGHGYPMGVSLAPT
jgi:hypothetical protein